MITDYENRAIRGSGRPVKQPVSVRVKRAWRGVVKGQILDKLPTAKRLSLLRAGFVELVESESKKPIAKPATKKKVAKPATKKKHVSV